MIFYMIVPPVSPWDEKYKTQIQLEMGAGTISTTAGGAWRRHTRDQMDKVQYWFDRGYRVRRIKINLIDDEKLEAKRSAKILAILKGAPKPDPQ